MTEENKTQISIDDFTKVELKVGQILEAHIVEGADKLYRFLVDIGETLQVLKEENSEGEISDELQNGSMENVETRKVYRTILSGIREFFPDKEIFIGKKVCVVTNLAPRKLRGYESTGMLLFAGGESGKLFSVTPDLDAPVGTTIR